MIRCITPDFYVYKTICGDFIVYNEGSLMVIMIILMLLLSVAFLVLLERKVLGGVQLRTGPVNVR